jgi:hypothetical protein
MITVDAAQLTETRQLKSDFGSARSVPDGTSQSILRQPDPRFGMDAPYAQSTSTKLPSGVSRTELQIVSKPP